MSERGRIPVKMKDKVLNIVKDYARQMGFNLSYSRRELKAVLGMAHSKVISGEAAEAGTGVSPRYIYAGLKSRLASWPESTGKGRSEEHTSELQSLMRISYAVFGLITKKEQKSSTTE